MKHDCHLVYKINPNITITKKLVENLKININEKFKNDKNILAFDVFWNGFRVEFNGVPVFSLKTNETFNVNNSLYWKNGIHNINEYGILYSDGFYNYLGPTGRGWSDKNLEILKNELKSII